VIAKTTFGKPLFFLLSGEGPFHRHTHTHKVLASILAYIALTLFLSSYVLDRNIILMMLLKFLSRMATRMAADRDIRTTFLIMTVGMFCGTILRHYNLRRRALTAAFEVETFPSSSPLDDPEDALNCLRNVDHLLQVLHQVDDVLNHLEDTLSNARNLERDGRRNIVYHQWKAFQRGEHTIETQLAFIENNLKSMATHITEDVGHTPSQLLLSDKLIKQESRWAKLKAFVIPSHT
jgi:hypothetical protein